MGERQVPRAEMTEALELMAQSASLGSADTHGYLKVIPNLGLSLERFRVYQRARTHAP